MHRLVIPVNESVALHWQQTTPEERTKIIGIFSWMVEKGTWKDFTPKTFTKLLDQLSDKAVENGLTPEIFDEILHES